MTLPLCLAAIIHNDIFEQSRVPAWSAHDLCLKCGYNLTGNTSGTCPECGTPIRAKSEVRA